MGDDITYEAVGTAQPAYQYDTQQTRDDASPKALPFKRKMVEIQRRLKVPKNQFNSFGGYHFRSCEDIQEGLKPLLDEYDVFLVITDEILFLEGRFYIKAIATATDVTTGESITTMSFAREPENRTGSDQSQVTGSSSSYARKYALNAMFIIDDTKDADVPISQGGKQPPAQGQFAARCRSCGTQYVFESAAQYQQFTANPGCCPNPSWEVL